MSSTNRGYDRHKSDYYVTPQKDIELFLSAFLQDKLEEGECIGDSPDRLLWCDPCAGGDKKNEMSYPAVIKRMLGIDIDTYDIREDSRAKIKLDILQDTMSGYDVIITNPPFDKALEIIKKALNEVNGGGYVIMLLRLNFFGSSKRFEFFQGNMPESCYVHHKRMSFTDNGSTDSIEYAHFVWKKGYDKSHTKLYVI